MSLFSKIVIVILALGTYPVFGISPKPLSQRQFTNYLQTIYQDHRITFFCEQPFSEEGNIHSRHCKNCASINTPIQWMPIVSKHQFARHLNCYREKLCMSKNGQLFKGLRCCKESDLTYQKMDMDLHNYVPEGELKSQRKRYRFGLIPNKIEIQGCHFYVDKKNKIIEPSPKNRGMIARTFLYMHDTYHIPLSQEEKILYQEWHQQYAISNWERLRNEKISAIQGNSNHYIK